MTVRRRSFAPLRMTIKGAQDDGKKNVIAPLGKHSSYLNCHPSRPSILGRAKGASAYIKNSGRCLSLTLFGGMTLFGCA